MAFCPMSAGRWLFCGRTSVLSLARVMALVMAWAVVWLLVLWVGGGSTAARAACLPVDEAFWPTVHVDGRDVLVRFDIAPGYHLYRDRFEINAVTTGLVVAADPLPAGRDYPDPALGTVPVWEERVEIPLRLSGPALSEAGELPRPRGRVGRPADWAACWPVCCPAAF